MNPLLEILQPAWFYPITHTQDPVLSPPQKISVQCPAQKISVQSRIVAFSIVPFVPFLGDRLRTWDANSECRARGLTLGSAGWAWQAAPCLRLKNLFSCLSPGIFILNLTFFFFPVLSCLVVCGSSGHSVHCQKPGWTTSAGNSGCIEALPPVRIKCWPRGNSHMLELCLACVRP